MSRQRARHSAISVTLMCQQYETHHFLDSVLPEVFAGLCPRHSLLPSYWSMVGEESCVINRPLNSVGVET
jgi:hypothetical protein